MLLLDSVQKETPVVSVMIQRLETDAIRDKKDNRPLLHQKRKHGLTERNPQKVQAAERQDSVRTFPQRKVHVSVMYFLAPSRVSQLQV